MGILTNHEKKRINKCFAKVDKVADDYPGFNAFVLVEGYEYLIPVIEGMGGNVKRNRFIKPSIVIFDELKNMKYKVHGDFAGELQYITVYDENDKKIGKLKKHNKLLKKDYVTFSLTNGKTSKLYSDGTTDILGISWKSKLLGLAAEFYNNGKLIARLDRKSGQDILLILDTADEQFCLMLALAKELIGSSKHSEIMNSPY